MTLRKFSNLLVTVLLLSTSFSSQAVVELVPAPPKINAKAFMLLDYNSGRILAESNIEKRIEPASLTKLMTTYAVLYELRNGSIKLDDEVKISEKAWRMKGSRMFVEVNSKVTVKKLMMGMIVQSGNDATVALAEHTAGSEDSFVTLMNKHAMNLGMVSTNFENSTGWPHKNHYTTVRDLSILAGAIIKEFPKHYQWYRVKEYTYNKITQRNRNMLLWQDERVDGMKTGHTDSAGYCLITSAKQKNMRLISIVTGSNSERGRARASRKLINYGFRFYETFLYHNTDEPFTEAKVWKGETDVLPLGLTEPLFITTPRGMKDKVTNTVVMNEETLTAPISKGSRYGQLHIKLGDKIIAKRHLVAMQDITSGGMFSRIIDYFLMLF
ncbi:MAG: D-alanyl-D-alanine carboxypeptidase [Gammaproteobacteria bacterium]|nr:D-alanyl-D-alanine carboxypeptidase [Gammaproteobacteria bacterium]